MPTSNEQLRQAYAATAYWFETPTEYVCLRAGEHNSALNSLLQQHGTQTWAFITAFNPDSQRLTPEENNQRQARLSYQLKGRYAIYPGAGVGLGGDWPPESSLMILGITSEEARILGNEHGQKAILVGRLGEPAELLWLAP